jgi:hypothetical protein
MKQRNLRLIASLFCVGFIFLGKDTSVLAQTNEELVYNVVEGNVGFSTTISSADVIEDINQTIKDNSDVESTTPNENLGDVVGEVQTTTYASLDVLDAFEDTEGENIVNTLLMVDYDSDETNKEVEDVVSTILANIPYTLQVGTYNIGGILTENKVKDVYLVVEPGVAYVQLTLDEQVYKVILEGLEYVPIDTSVDAYEGTWFEASLTDVLNQGLLELPSNTEDNLSASVTIAEALEAINRVRVLNGDFSAKSTRDTIENIVRVSGIDSLEDNFGVKNLLLSLDTEVLGEFTLSEPDLLSESITRNYLAQWLNLLYDDISYEGMATTHLGLLVGYPDGELHLEDDLTYAQLVAVMDRLNTLYSKGSI